MLTGMAAVAAVSAASVQGAVHVVKYIVPEARSRQRETFLAYASEIPENGTLEVVLPDQRRVQVRRMGEEYAGFSNVCPHLGCRVYWQAPSDGETDARKKDGFFRCPCHEGYFGPDGKAFSGPPADAKQSLTRIPLEMRGSALYVTWKENL